MLDCVMDEIAAIRKQIDELDERILDLVQKRVQHAINIRRLKLERNIPLVTPEREQELIHHLVEVSGGRLPAEVITQIWDSIIEGGKQTQDH